MSGFVQRTSFEWGDVRITVLERTRIEHYQDDTGFVVVASKEPDAVVLEEKDGGYEMLAVR